MTHGEPDFLVLEYVTLTKDPLTGLVIAIGGTGQVADILQRSGFLDADGPRGPYHRLPHGLPVREQRLKVTAASHALMSAGHSVSLDPALNAFDTADGDRDVALRYLTELAERAADATSDTEVAEVLTAVAAPTTGLLPLVREVVVRAGSPSPVKRTAQARNRSRSPSSEIRRRTLRAPPTGSSSPATTPPAPRSSRHPPRRRQAQYSRQPPWPDGAVELKDRRWQIWPTSTAPTSRSISRP